MGRPYLVTESAPRGVDVLELVGRAYATDPAIALQWVTLDDENIAKFEATGWKRVTEGGIAVTAMGMQLMRKDRRAVDAEHRANAEKGEQNFRDAVAAHGGAVTVKTTWVKDPTK